MLQVIIDYFIWSLIFVVYTLLMMAKIIFKV
jgi:hypothetical protein